MELTIILGISVIGLLFALYLIRNVLRMDTGTEKMQEISNAIKQGAEAFLRHKDVPRHRYGFTYYTGGITLFFFLIR